MDATAVLSALLNAGPARRLLSEECVWVSSATDGAVIDGLHRGVASGRLSEEAAAAAARTWWRLGVRRHAGAGVVDRAWSLRRQLAAEAALSLALAEALGCGLVTADPAAADIDSAQCPVTVVPK